MKEVGDIVNLIGWKMSPFCDVSLIAIVILNSCPEPTNRPHFRLCQDTHPIIMLYTPPVIITSCIWLIDTHRASAAPASSSALALLSWLTGGQARCPLCVGAFASH
jgi:hypothetical protein